MMGDLGPLNDATGSRKLSSSLVGHGNKPVDYDVNPNNTANDPDATALGESGKICTLKTVSDFENDMKLNTEEKISLYFNSGSGDNVTLKENCTALQRWRIVPRSLRDVSSVNTSLSLLGYDLSSPIGIAPTALQRNLHTDAELAVARAAHARGHVMVQSMMSSYSMEEVASASPSCMRWQQLYIYSKEHREFSLKIARRAELSGAKALVVTVDHPKTYSKRPYTKLYGHNLNNILSDFYVGNLSCDQDLQIPPFNSSLEWADIDWLVSMTSLPVILKGILHPDDAKEALRHGVAAIYVSNHGGRQLDSVISTADALPDILAAVGGKCPILVDGGVRSGLDVFRLLALGADVVLVGRPVLWGLASGGQSGVTQVLKSLQEELEETMTLSGCRDLRDVWNTKLVNCADWPIYSISSSDWSNPSDIHQ